MNVREFFNSSFIVPNSSLIHIPIFVQGIFAAAQASCPAPLMGANRTSPACVESVPARAARLVKEFWKVRIGAPPATRFLRLPFTKRTANPAVICFV